MTRPPKCFLSALYKLPSPDPPRDSHGPDAARSAEPTAKSEVALAFPGCAVSFCPHCGSHHREVTYAFLSSEPVCCSVAKASADHQWSARDPPRCYHTILEQTAAFSVTPGEKSFHTVQPPAVCTSDLRPRSQARHLHCRRHRSTSANNRKHYCSAASPCSAAHLQLAARTTRTSGPASTLLSRTSACLPTTPRPPSSSLTVTGSQPAVTLEMELDFKFQSWHPLVPACT